MQGWLGDGSCCHCVWVTDDVTSVTPQPVRKGDIVLCKLLLVICLDQVFTLHAALACTVVLVWRLQEVQVAGLRPFCLRLSPDGNKGFRFTSCSLYQYTL